MRCTAVCYGCCGLITLIFMTKLLLHIILTLCTVQPPNKDPILTNCLQYPLLFHSFVYLFFMYYYRYMFRFWVGQIPYFLNYYEYNFTYSYFKFLNKWSQKCIIIVIPIWMLFNNCDIVVILISSLAVILISRQNII